MDFVLGQATCLKGRVTVAENGRPLSGIPLHLELDAGQVPAELRCPNDQARHDLRMDFYRNTDRDGSYFFFLAPGTYQLKTPLRTEPVRIAVPADNPPAEIVRDLQGTTAGKRKPQLRRP